MREFHFDRIRNIDKSYRKIPASIQTEKIRDVAESFSSNLDRTLAICELPVALIYTAWMLMKNGQRSVQQPIVLATKKPALSVLPKGEADPFAEVADLLVGNATIESR